MNDLQIAGELQAVLRRLEQQRRVHDDRIHDEGHRSAEYAYSIAIREIGKVADRILAEPTQ
jgi:hypothetical protein